MPSVTDRVNSIMEIVGAFFVDAFHNKLYTRAKSIYNTRNDSNASIGPIYASCVLEYAKGASNGFNIIMKNMQKYFQKHTNNNVMTLRQVYDELINIYIPREFTHTLSDAKKESLLKFLIKNIVNKFATLAVKPENIKLTIDMRSENSTVRPLQDCIINEVLYPLRDQFYHHISNSVLNDGKKSTDMDKVDVSVVTRLRKEYEKLHQILEDKNKHIVELTNALHKLRDKVNELEQNKTMGGVSNEKYAEEIEQRDSKIKILEFKVQEMQKELEGNGETDDDENIDEDISNNIDENIEEQ